MTKWNWSYEFKCPICKKTHARKAGSLSKAAKKIIKQDGWIITTAVSGVGMMICKECALSLAKTPPVIYRDTDWLAEKR